MMNAFYVYILKCSDDSYYVGHTDDIDRRIAEHKSGLYPSCHTATRLPVEVVFIQDFPERSDALDLERTLKKWTRKKKEALIQGRYSNLIGLAKKKFK